VVLLTEVVIFVVTVVGIFVDLMISLYSFTIPFKLIILSLV